MVDVLSPTAYLIKGLSEKREKFRVKKLTHCWSINESAINGLLFSFANNEEEGIQIPGVDGSLPEGDARKNFLAKGSQACLPGTHRNQRDGSALPKRSDHLSPNLQDDIPYQRVTENPRRRGRPKGKVSKPGKLGDSDFIII